MSDPTPKAPAIDVDGVSFTYVGADGARVEALSDVSLRIEPGERLGILGPNGGGKSTLLKLMLGLLTPDQGSIRVCGRAPIEARHAHLIGYVPQRTSAELGFPLSVRQVVAMGVGQRVRGWRRLPGAMRGAVDEALELVEMGELGERPIGQLSGGQVQRAMLARAMALRPAVLLLDEPMVGVDVRGQERFAALLNRIGGDTGAAVVTVSHDLRAVAACSDRVACLSRTLHSHVSPSGLTPEVLAEVFRHDVEAIFGEVHVEAHRADACPGHHGAGGRPDSEGVARADD